MLRCQKTAQLTEEKKIFFYGVGWAKLAGNCGKLGKWVGCTGDIIGAF